MSAISPSTQEAQSVFFLWHSPDSSHLSFRLNPLRTRNDDELKHAVLKEVMKQSWTLSSDTDGRHRYLMHSGKDGEEQPMSHEQDHERFLVFRDIEPDAAKIILDERDRELEKLRVGYNSVHKSLSFVVMSTFIHDVPISWITHVIGMACFERKLTPSELNLLEVGSTARELASQMNYKTFFFCCSPLIKDQGFTGNYSLSGKEPDAFITPYDRYWPTIMVESGWSETRASLEVNADLWLRGTQGQVSAVIIVKWTKIPHTKSVCGDLKVRDSQIEVRGYTFLYAMTSIDHLTEFVENIFPRPANHASQVVQISKSVLFGDTRPNITHPTSNIPFPIDALRESARRAIEKDGYFPA